jgi:ribonuclease P protein component
MLQKAYRLKSNVAFFATYKQGNVVSNAYFTLFGGRLKEKDSTSTTKFGFVVSKKVHKRAVKRNRIKRLMRESTRLIIANNEREEINNYTSMVFVAKEKALDMDFNTANLAILNLIDRLVKNTTSKNINI